MSVKLRELCFESNVNNGIYLVAGEAGLDNSVLWIHTLEDEEVGDFLNGGELIFTTGIGNRNDAPKDWLLLLVKKLYANKASGIVVNVGPYIPKIPQEIVDFCNEVGFPLFSMPWQVRVVNITREMCRMLVEKEKKEETIGYSIKNIILDPTNISKYTYNLENNEINIDEPCCLIALDSNIISKNTFHDLIFLRQLLNVRIKNIADKIGTFTYNESIYYVVFNSSEEVISQIKLVLAEFCKDPKYKDDIFFFISSYSENVKHLPSNFARISLMMNYAHNCEDHILVYDELGIKKVLLSVYDKKVLSEYCFQKIGKIEEYDSVNHTELVNFFKLYLENDCSVQKISELTFTHRNTVNYQIKKIKSILGDDILSFSEKAEMYLALHIRDIIKS